MRPAPGLSPALRRPRGPRSCQGPLFALGPEVQVRICPDHRLQIWDPRQQFLEPSLPLFVALLAVALNLARMALPPLEAILQPAVLLRQPLTFDLPTVGWSPHAVRLPRPARALPARLRPTCRHAVSPTAPCRPLPRCVAPFRRRPRTHAPPCPAGSRHSPCSAWATGGSRHGAKSRRTSATLPVSAAGSRGVLPPQPLRCKARRVRGRPGAAPVVTPPARSSGRRPPTGMNPPCPAPPTGRPPTHFTE